MHLLAATSEIRVAYKDKVEFCFGCFGELWKGYLVLMIEVVTGPDPKVVEVGFVCPWFVETGAGGLVKIKCFCDGITLDVHVYNKTLLTGLSQADRCVYGDRDRKTLYT